MDFELVTKGTFIVAKPIRAGQGHSMTGIRGGGILSGGGAGAVPPKIITDDVNKRKSLKGESGLSICAEHSFHQAVMFHLSEIES